MLNSYSIFPQLEDYCQQHNFRPSTKMEIKDNPFHRPLPNRGFKHVDFSKPLNRNNIFSYSSFFANKLLRNIYESDFLYLPKMNTFSLIREFESFYSQKSRILGESMLPTLEEHVFGFLNDEVLPDESLCSDKLIDFFKIENERFFSSEPSLKKTILNSKNPQRAACNLILKMTPDTLSEASALSRKAGGSFGEAQCELFRILIDEYGNGKQNSKHSFLFQKLLESIGLASDVHSYWNYYTPSCLLLHNYFQYISKSHSLYFEYIGNLFFAESTFSHTSKACASVLREVFNGLIDVSYFEEHTEVDVYHGAHVLEKLVKPLLRTYGDTAAKKIYKGYMHFKILSKMVQEDFDDYIYWIDNLDILNNVAHNQGKIISEHKFTRENKIAFVDIADQDQFLSVKKGNIVCYIGCNNQILLNSGESMLINKNRLYSFLPAEGACVQTFEV